MHTSCDLDFASRLAAAEDWLDFAIEAQQEGDWKPDDTERGILADLVAATNPLHGGALPPHTGDSLYVRIGRICNWAGAVRLAARAGGWELSPVTGQDPSALTRPAGMAALLSGIYALAEQGERWQELLLTTARTVSRGRTLEQEISARHPHLERELAAAESFFTGPGSLEDLSLFFY
ncbi:hypothetical protein FGW37_20700 [Streptomyces rectiverticillatus]|uniref:hypothetical protein n=1 Tax=Streptomyces rectiverticillatus TaxID=173860 RepID=UPI0015C40029|nr:hypothetical protein [Streptomyces rectiverticillatus]QLE73678.1 hypothetical protein FGW37_20700 [Streptomyces rectiverticillatus]